MNRIITYCLGIVLLFGACNDFLEPKSNTDFVPKDVSSLEELMAGAYKTGTFTILFMATQDDDIDGGEFVPDRTSRLDGLLSAFSWQPNMFETFEDVNVDEQWIELWGAGYDRILVCNAILDYLDGVSGSQESKAYLLGQALTMRAFTYLHLVNVFGAPYSFDKKALGVPLKLNSSISEKLISRNTVEECYAAIEKDLLDAERTYLTVSKEKQWRPDYRVSLPMVQLLLSRMYLQMEAWGKAHEYAEKVIMDYSFRLKDLNEIVRTEEAPYYDFSDIGCPEQIFLYAEWGDATCFISNLLVQGDRWSFVASPDLLKNYAESDLRRENYIFNEPGCTKEAPDGMPWDTLVLRPAGKYKVNKGGEATSSSKTVQSLRVAEAYLNSMEAAAFLYKGGDANMLTNSMSRLEGLRAKRYRLRDYKRLENMSDPNKLISYIRDERRRELCFEGHRWFDLRRYGMPEIKHHWYTADNQCVEYVLKEKDPGYTIPVPLSARRNNSSLVQNPLGAKREGIFVK